MKIEGTALRQARKRMGYRSQQAAADAMGVSLRKYGDLERKGIGDEDGDYVKAALEAFWPNEHQDEPSLADFDDIALLTEIGQRFTRYKRERDEALAQLAGRDESETKTAAEQTDRSPTLPESPPATRFTGKRPPRPTST